MKKMQSIKQKIEPVHNKTFLKTKLKPHSDEFFS